MNVKLIAILFLAAIVYLGYAFSTVDRRDDVTRINSTLSNTATAVENRDLDGAISCVSEDYKDKSGLTYERLRALVAQALRIEEDYTVQSEFNKPVINGDAASVTGNVKVTKTNGEKLYDRNITVYLRNEKGLHAWVIPVKVWRVVRVDNLGLDINQDFTGF